MNTFLSRKIMELLQARARGEEHALPGREIRRQLIDGGFRLGDRKMRKIIEGDLPQICFNGKGYFLPASPAEARKTADRIEHYIRGLAMRRKAILSAFDTGRQIELGI